MSDSLTIARPYARAVYERAVESNNVENWQQFLDLAAHVFGDEEVIKRLELGGFMQSVHSWLDELLQQQRDAGLQKEEKNFLALLDEFDRYKVVPQIAQLFSEQRRLAQQKIFAKVISANVLSEEQIKEIDSSLEKRFGKEVELQIEVKPELIAGIRIKVENQVIDNTVEGRLERFIRLLDVSRG